MNLVIKIGRLTKEPELRFTSNGKAVVSFDIAVRKKFKQEGQKDADFFKCVAWNKGAQYLADNITKGKRIAIVGRSENKSYTNQQGQEVRYDEITVDDFEIIDYANDNQQGGNYQNNQAPQQSRQQQPYQGSFPNVDPMQKPDPFANSGGGTLDINDDDLPF